MNNFKPLLETIYDNYSPMLYGMAVDIVPTKQEAEDILITTFKTFHDKGLIQQNYPSHCITLIKLLIHTAREQLNIKEEKNNFRLKQFENSPLLHKILCEQAGPGCHYIENDLSREAFGKKLREEFNSLDRFKKEKKVLSSLN